MVDAGVFNIAQVNIAIPAAPVDSERLAGFMALLDPVNGIADGSPGFVWRLQTDDGNATGIRAFDDDRLIVNMSVWTSLEALSDFVFRSDHLAVLRRRREWFERTGEAYLALWWVPAGTIPTIADAEDRIAHVRAHGPTDYAFTFRQSFPAPTSPPPGGAGEGSSPPPGIPAPEPETPAAAAAPPSGG
ncbi:MAG: DUF3291 domain-containing protein [Acidimicrobiales bacterium]